MSLRVMRPTDGIMMKLVKYELVDGIAGTDTAAEIVHNHALNPNNEDELTQG